MAGFEEEMMIEFFIIGLLISIVVLFAWRLRALHKRLADLRSGKQSLSTRYGQIFEQLLPFSSSFPGNPERFRFIGDPIDGLLFEEDKVVFCEIKLNNSKLNDRQRKIKELILQKKVEWKEIRGDITP